MKKMLVTGGTVFVSKSIAEYFSKTYDVYVLNRNTHPQPENTTLIECDRADLGKRLEKFNFDYVVDVSSYSKADISAILSSLGGTISSGGNGSSDKNNSHDKTSLSSGTTSTVEKYIFISSSAVYPETLKLPFKETDVTGRNKFWGDYGTNKLEAENYLFSKKADAYVIRPPYLYGPKNNVYREAFVFDCAEAERNFCIPKNGKMKMQFFYIEDLCRLIQAIIEKSPENHVINCGNSEGVSILEWAELCYTAVGKPFRYKNILSPNIEQRNYFPFYDYEYILDTTVQDSLLTSTTPLLEGLKKSYEWYKENRGEVRRKNYIEFIDTNFNK